VGKLRELIRILAPAVAALHATGATKEEVARVLRDAAGMVDGADPLDWTRKPRQRNEPRRIGADA